MEFQNKVSVITGASVGIGKATALAFAKQGAIVCIADVDLPTLQKAESEVRALGATVSAYHCDVSDEKAVHEMMQDILQKYNKIDILINNAGIWRGSQPFVESESSDWKRRIDVNILGLMYCTHAVLPSMIKNQYGRIINIGSVAGCYGNRNMAAYSMTKGAVSSFTKALAKEVADQGITVNNVLPGTVRNEVSSSPKLDTDLCYMGRTGKLEEFAYLICFLASDKAAYISGQDYQIDGCRRKI